eukprot:scaffold5794_cov141-Cylindrotheca_fusiformis.AAC.2
MEDTLIDVKLIWGIDVNRRGPGPWVVKRRTDNTNENAGTVLLQGIEPGFDLSKSETQQWILDVVLAAKSDESLNVRQDEPTWIEVFHEFAVRQDTGFPVPDNLFMVSIELLKSTNKAFDKLVKDEIGTLLPGMAGETLYASVTIPSYEGSSMTTLDQWTRFAEEMNARAPNEALHMVAQSDLFWNDARASETVDATVDTWLIANGLCCLIILFFTKNILLSLMVIVAVFLMFFCIAGWLFAIFNLPLGPVQALGVSVFIGLSANYALHVVHAYHHSMDKDRESKVKHAVFLTGSPICASAISTIGGCAFLLGCRTIALVELGILICCVTAMALLYSMGFLLAWLLLMGPLPYGDEDDGNRRSVHRWDAFAMCSTLFRFLNKGFTGCRSNLQANGKPEGNGSLRRTTGEQDGSSARFLNLFNSGDLGFKVHASYSNRHLHETYANRRGDSSNDDLEAHAQPDQDVREWTVLPAKVVASQEEAIPQYYSVASALPDIAEELVLESDFHSPYDSTTPPDYDDLRSFPTLTVTQPRDNTSNTARGAWDRPLMIQPSGATIAQPDTVTGASTAEVGTFPSDLTSGDKSLLQSLCRTLEEHKRWMLRFEEERRNDQALYAGQGSSIAQIQSDVQNYEESMKMEFAAQSKIIDNVVNSQEALRCESLRAMDQFKAAFTEEISSFSKTVMRLIKTLEDHQSPGQTPSSLTGDSGAESVKSPGQTPSSLTGDSGVESVIPRPSPVTVDQKR